MLRRRSKDRGFGDPVVIGATGGSGTRVVVQILQAFGVALGNRLNESLDPFVFMRFYDRWIERFVLDRTGRGGLGRVERRQIVDELRKTVAGHVEDAKPSPGGAWGWKSPRSIFFVPLLDDVYPAMRFVHVVRDPRDMAFSANQRQLEAHGSLFLTAEEQREPQPVQSALMWRRVNEDARAHGSKMGERYMLIRFEDICAEPTRASERLAAFVGADVDPERLREAASHVSPPASVERWKQEDPSILERIHAALADSLEHYGYTR